MDNHIKTVGRFIVSCVVCGARASKAYLRAGYSLFKCNRCDHLFLYPIPSLYELRAGYAAENTAFVNNPEGTLEHLEKSETLCFKTSEYLNNLLYSKSQDRYKRLLDIGAGAGKIMRRAREAGWLVEGIEPGPWGKEASARYGLDIYSVMIEDMPLSNLFQKNTYDMIVMTDVLEHLRDPVIALEIILPYLKTGGIIIFQFPYSSSLSHWTRRCYWPLILPPGHIHYFSKRSIKYLLNSSGLVRKHSFTQAHSPILPKAYVQPIDQLDKLLKGVVEILHMGDLISIFCEKPQYKLI